MIKLAALFLAVTLPVGFCKPKPPGPQPTPVPSPTATPTPAPTPKPTPTPTPPPACQAPSGTSTLVGGNPVLQDSVDQAVATIKSLNPGMFSGDNLAGWIPDSNSPVGAQKAHDFYLLLQQVLIQNGLCSALGSDDIGVLEPGTGRWEWSKLVVYTVGRVRSFGEGFEGVFVYNAPPTPGPVGACPLVADPAKLRATIKPVLQASLYLDATFEYDYGRDPASGEGLGPCLNANGVGHREWCPIGVDDAAGHTHDACPDALVGVPQFSSDTVQLTPGFNGSTYKAKVESGTGLVTVCSQVLPKSCGSVKL